MTDEGWEYGWWTSAWYAGYWSYWTISGSNTEWMYSGTGFTGRQLSDGCIDGWSLTMFESPKVGGVGEGVPPSDDENVYVYCEPKASTSTSQIVVDDNATEEYFTLSGVRVDKRQLTPGLYIVRKGNHVEKRSIH